VKDARPFLRSLSALDVPEETPPSPAVPAEDTILLRAVRRPDTPDLLERLEKELSPEDRNAAAALPHPDRRAEFAAGHWMRARVLREDPALRASLSHAGGWVVLAAGARGPLGGDVEAVRPRAGVERIAARFFTPEEHACLAACAEPGRTLLFYALWTAKEARIKALPRRENAPPHGPGILALMETDLSRAPETTAFGTVALPVPGGALHWFWWPETAPGTPRLLGACLCPNGTTRLLFVRESVG
jgi:4'-phosphopantetheinyl transferase EntD